MDKLKVRLTLKVKCPRTPNYIRSASEKISYHISEFTDEELKRIGEMWTNELIRKAKHSKEL